MIYNIIPQNSLSFGPVIVPFPITIPRDEFTFPLIIEVHDRGAGTFDSTTLTLTEMPQSTSIQLSFDLHFPHVGQYELLKAPRAKAAGVLSRPSTLSACLV